MGLLVLPDTLALKEKLVPEGQLVIMELLVKEVYLASPVQQVKKATPELLVQEVILEVLVKRAVLVALVLKVLLVQVVTVSRDLQVFPGILALAARPDPLVPLIPVQRVPPVLLVPLVHSLAKA
jgi:hypothetical protein